MVTGLEENPPKFSNTIKEGEEGDGEGREAGKMLQKEIPSFPHSAERQM